MTVALVAVVSYRPLPILLRILFPSFGTGSPGWNTLAPNPKTSTYANVQRISLELVPSGTLFNISKDWLRLPSFSGFLPGVVQKPYSRLSVRITVVTPSWDIMG